MSLSRQAIFTTLQQRAKWVSLYLAVLLCLVLAGPTALAGRQMAESGPKPPPVAPDAVRPASVGPEFTETILLENPSLYSSFTAVNFAPDGRLFFSVQAGKLYWLDQNQAGAAPVLALDLLAGTPARLCNNQERGLLGMAFDPDFAHNGYIYLFYTFNRFNQPPNNCDISGTQYPVNRVSRFTFNLPQKTTVNPLSELVLLDNIPSLAGFHQAGDIHFGPDNLLYISTGDSGCTLDSNNAVTGICSGSNTNSRRLNLLTGKILRVDRNGNIPAGNPRVNEPGSRRCGDPALPPDFQAAGTCQEMFAWGLRNPYRFAFRPASSEFYINDVGQNIWEEINSGQLNADYGWNEREGFCLNGSTTQCSPPADGKVDPVFSYQHLNDCNSVTAAAFVPAGLWPAAYDNKYLYTDYGCQKLFRLDPVAGGGFNPVEIAWGLYYPISMKFGPFNGPNNQTQALYLTSYYTIRRIHYSGSANRSPSAAFSAAPVSGPAPLSVSFNAGASSDPDPGNTLTYQWNFGDGSSVETAGPAVSHTYNSNGVYYPSLVVRDNLGGMSAAVNRRIDVGNSPPVAQIIAPGASDRFTVGQNLILQGVAEDAEDGLLPSSALRWKVIKYHGNHFHPYYPETTGNNLPLPPAPAPEDLAAVNNTYLEITLTVTDSQGLTTTVTRQLLPNIVYLTFNTAPPGRVFEVNSTVYTGTTSLASWSGYGLPVNAPAQSSATNSFAFAAWSDDGAAAHTLVSPGLDSLITASFTGTTCVPQVVTSAEDGTACGTLRGALAAAGAGGTVGFALNNPQKSLYLGSPLDITGPVNLQGVCAAGGPQVKIKPAAAVTLRSPLALLRLSGGVKLNGVWLSGFADKQLSIGSGSNRLNCSRVTSVAAP